MRFLTIAQIAFKNLELLLRDVLKLQMRPYKLLLELTDYCNSKCKTCHIWKNNGELKNEIRIEELEPVLQDYGRNLLWVALSGGEVTLYRDFNKLVKLLEKHCPNLRIVSFTTNALKPEKVVEFAQRIKSAGYDLFVNVSLDGDKATHDHVRGVEGNFELAEQTLRLLVKNGIQAHYGLTVSEHNQEFIQQKLAFEIKSIRAFSFEHSGGIYKTDSAADSGMMTAAIQKISGLYRVKSPGELVEAIYIALAKKFFGANKSKLPIPCEVVSTSLHIRPNGDIKPCMYLPALGNIKTDLLTGVLQTSKASVAHQKAQRGDCEKCWMNCYAPHSIMRHPIKALLECF